MQEPRLRYPKPIMKPAKRARDPVSAWSQGLSVKSGRGRPNREAASVSFSERIGIRENRLIHKSVRSHTLRRARYLGVLFWRRSSSSRPTMCGRSPQPPSHQRQCRAETEIGRREPTESPGVLFAMYEEYMRKAIEVARRNQTRLWSPCWSMPNWKDRGGRRESLAEERRRARADLRSLRQVASRLRHAM